MRHLTFEDFTRLESVVVDYERVPYNDHMAQVTTEIDDIRKIKLVPYVQDGRTFDGIKQLVGANGEYLGHGTSMEADFQRRQARADMLETYQRQLEAWTREKYNSLFGQETKPEIGPRELPWQRALTYNGRTAAPVHAK